MNNGQECSEYKINIISLYKWFPHPSPVPHIVYRLSAKCQHTIQKKSQKETKFNTKLPSKTVMLMLWLWVFLPPPLRSSKWSILCGFTIETPLYSTHPPILAKGFTNRKGTRHNRIPISDAFFIASIGWCLLFSQQSYLFLRRAYCLGEKNALTSSYVRSCKIIKLG